MNTFHDVLNDSIDLLFTSPPYLSARTYGRDDVARGLDEWVAWMVEFVRIFSPKVKGLIAINCEGQTRSYKYLPAPFLLAADLHRAGFNLRKPPVFHRVGIPGSGGPDWLRNDYEPIICVTREGKLPWSDNTACGHPPKWAPGGEMSHQSTNGRVNQWGHSIASGATVVDDGGVVRSKGKRPSHVESPQRVRMAELVADGKSQREAAREVGFPMKATSSTSTAGDTITGNTYVPPVLANPGNTIETKYTVDEVLELLASLGIADEAMSELLRIQVGGGLMGHPLSHENEAPFPLDLPAFFVKSFCPPDGITCDPFSGSGTTCHAAYENGRRFIGNDIRQSQVDLCARRLATVTPAMFTDAA